MKFNRVLIVYKKLSFLQTEGVSGFKEKIEKEQKEHYDLHTNSIEHLTSLLKKLGIDHELAERGKICEIPSKYDLIITVGGDGTVLYGSHFAKNLPLLGLNSDPKSSIGRFCLAREQNVESILTKINSGEIEPTLLPLIEGFSAGKTFYPLAINDILVTSQSPAESLKYYIKIGDNLEKQLSSGLWASTAAGSTGGIGSAGGKVQDIKRDEIQYLVREPLLSQKSNYKLLHGHIKRDQSIEIIPIGNNCIAFIDGPRDHRHIPFGETLTIRHSDKFLKVFI